MRKKRASPLQAGPVTAKPCEMALSDDGQLLFTESAFCKEYVVSLLALVISLFMPKPGQDCPEPDKDCGEKMLMAEQTVINRRNEPVAEE